MKQFPAFVISLPEAHARRQAMKVQLDRLGIEFSFFDAVDGRGFDVPSHPAYDAVRRRAFFGRDMTGGEIGCLLSHRGLYKKIVEEGLDAAVIFEDDAMLHDDLPKVLAALASCKVPYDLLRFLGSEKVALSPQKIIAPVTQGYTLNRLCTTPGGAHAYLITQEGTRKMLRQMQKNYLPVDTLMGHVWKTGIRAFIIQPGIALHDLDQPSFIGDARFDKKSDAVKPWYYPASRALFKAYEGAMKRIAFHLPRR